MSYEDLLAEHNRKKTRVFPPNHIIRTIVPPRPVKEAEPLTPTCKHGFVDGMTFVGPFGRIIVTDHNDCPDARGRPRGR